MGAAETQRGAAAEDGAPGGAPHQVRARGQFWGGGGSSGRPPGRTVGRQWPPSAGTLGGRGRGARGAGGDAGEAGAKPSLCLEILRPVRPQSDRAGQAEEAPAQELAPLLDLEPKVMAPFLSRPGETPRMVLIERYSLAAAAAAERGGGDRDAARLSPTAFLPRNACPQRNR